MDTNNSNENAIIENNDKLKTTDNEALESVQGKVLLVTPKSKGVDFSGILSKLTQYINIADVVSHVEKGVEYVVQIPVKYREAFEAGELLINENSKTGVMWPSLYKTVEGGKRQLVANLPIKPQEIVKGNPFEKVAESYNNIYMQQQINELAELIGQTLNTVKRIEQGQMDDRIGLLLAGRDQIILSLNQSPEDRKNEIELGRTNLLTAQKQILQTFRSRVESFESIPKGRIKRFFLALKHNEYYSEKDNEFDVVQEYYSLFIQATQMVAASYLLCGQQESANKVFTIAGQDMKDIDFEAIKSLKYIHKDNPEMFYYHAEEYIETERQICFEDAKEYDIMKIAVQGDKLLEVFASERTEEISETDAE